MLCCAVQCRYSLQCSDPVGWCCTGTRDPYSTYGNPSIPQNLQPCRTLLLKKPHYRSPHVISYRTDSYVLQKTVPESGKRAARYSQIRRIYRQILNSRIRAYILPRSDTSIPRACPHQRRCKFLLPLQSHVSTPPHQGHSLPPRPWGHIYPYSLFVSPQHCLHSPKTPANTSQTPPPPPPCPPPPPTPTTTTSHPSSPTPPTSTPPPPPQPLFPTPPPAVP